jgi:hypothetical protein
MVHAGVHLKHAVQSGPVIIYMAFDRHENSCACYSMTRRMGRQVRLSQRDGSCGWVRSGGTSWFRLVNRRTEYGVTKEVWVSLLQGSPIDAEPGIRLTRFVGRRLAASGTPPR